MFSMLVRLVREYQKHCSQADPVKTATVKRASAPLDVQGEHFNLNERLQFVLDNYLKGKLDTSPTITWFGNKHGAAYRRRLLGAYFPKDHKIKVHRVLDQKEIPDYFLDYVIYHEVVHALHPPLRRRGKGHRIHHAEFREAERQFPFFRKAKEWEKNNKHRLLTITDKTYGGS